MPAAWQHHGMGAKSKVERRREKARQAMGDPKPRRPELPRCKVCGAEGRFEVYKGPTCIRHYCERHIRDEL